MRLLTGSHAAVDAEGPQWVASTRLAVGLLLPFERLSLASGQREPCGQKETGTGPQCRRDREADREGHDSLCRRAGFRQPEAGVTD
jgi:hypothetical protein